MEHKINLLCKAMSEVLDNQLRIMKHLGIIQNDYMWGDGCDSVRELSNELYRHGNQEYEDEAEF